MFKRLTLPLGLALLMLAGTALAADPTGAQIYQAVQSGNLAQAQQMIQQVLKDHPNSAKAHFIAAEVDARAQNFGQARQELATAQALKPGLPFASQHAVRELQTQLGMAAGSTRQSTPFAQQAVRHRSHVGAGLLLIIGIIIVWMILRRRMAAARYGGYPGQVPGAMPGQMPPGGPMGGPGYGAGYPPPGYGPGYGQGPGIMSSLGTGLAMGAGVVAGEELVDHMLNRGAGAGGVIPDAGAAQPDPQVNADMGGNDFGVSDPGSWDDGGGGGGGWDSGGGDGGWT